MEVKYGRREIDGELTGLATYEVDGKKTLLLSKPFEALLVFEDGQPVKPTSTHVIIWTKVAGWLGNDQLIAELGLKPKGG